MLRGLPGCAGDAGVDCSATMIAKARSVDPLGDYVLGDLSMVLLMSVNPGFGGQAFVPQVLDKVRTLRDEADRRGLDLDIEVDDLSSAAARALSLGATMADFQPQDDVRVLLDPAGHPFCLYVRTDSST